MGHLPEGDPDWERYAQSVLDHIAREKRLRHRQVLERLVEREMRELGSVTLEQIKAAARELSMLTDFADELLEAERKLLERARRQDPTVRLPDLDRQLDRLREEASQLAADPEDRAEIRAVREEMDELAAPVVPDDFDELPPDIAVPFGMLERDYGPSSRVQLSGALYAELRARVIAPLESLPEQAFGEHSGRDDDTVPAATPGASRAACTEDVEEQAIASAWLVDAFRLEHGVRVDGGVRVELDRDLMEELLRQALRRAPRLLPALAQALCAALAASE